jgi:hypothetical protein
MADSFFRILCYISVHLYVSSGTSALRNSVYSPSTHIVEKCVSQYIYPATADVTVCYLELGTATGRANMSLSCV